jgi:hypothetical protein
MLFGRLARNGCDSTLVQESVKVVVAAAVFPVAGVVMGVSPLAVVLKTLLCRRLG